MLLVFERLESVNTALQKKSLQFTRAELLVKAVEESIGQLREDFSSFWADVSDEEREMEIGAPSVPKRTRQAPRRYDEGSHAHDFNSPEAFYRQWFYLVIDTVHASLRTRFPPEMWHHMTQVEQFVTGETDSTYLCEFCKGDLNAVRLQLHRDMLLDIAKQRATSLVTFQDVVDLLSGKAGESLRVLLPEVVKLLQIAMTIPVTSCSSERSFSCLRRVKTYLRSTMGQARLNHTALLHCHKELARQVDLDLVANEFIH
ncbi:zinc finger MYM-type protein 1-like [Ixodes scapularis]|uniref:zinc finger MYM-type protein 1-like n=1 Tax=Ixodes scapularis TaxID=6945 RepID=UPI001A9FF730|nr:zinc finger MYM-type protein 1-like [Ixodes scapularis]